MKTQYLIALAATATLSLAASAHSAPHSITEMIREYDLNGDGKVTREEFDAERKVRFLATDTDGKGTLSEAEYVNEYEPRLTRELAGDSDPVHRKAEYDRGLKQTHVRFGILDSNHDGQMTIDEYQVSGHAMFNRQDLDHDGVISRADSDRLKTEEKQGKGDDFIQP